MAWPREMTENDRTIANRQLRFMQQRGLEPHHTLLDVGCGWLRAGELFIAYLDPGKYTGLEKDEESLQLAQKVLDKLEGKHPNIVVTADFEIPSPSYDFGLMHSVLTHMTPAQIVRCLTAVLPRVTALYATFNRCDIIDIGHTHTHRADEQHKTRYPFVVLQGLAMAAGATTVVDHGWFGHPGGQEWMEMRL